MAEATGKNHWPLWLAPLTAIVLPTATVRRTGRMHHWQALLIHAAGLVLFLLAMLMTSSWASAGSLHPVAWWPAFVDQVTRMPAELAQRDRLAPLLGVLAALEVGFLLGAWCLMAWGARDEPVPAALAGALRRLWCVTPHAALLWLLVGVVTVPVNQAYADAEARWEQRLGAASAGADDDAQVIAQRQAAWAQYVQTQPWYVRYHGAIDLSAWVAAGLWLPIVLLRVGAAPRWGARCRWPPVCDGCGYTILGLDRSSACPECGLSLSASIGVDARGGLQFDKAQHGSWLSAWWRCAVAALKPIALGQQLRAMAPEGSHRRFFAVNTVLLALIMAGGALVMSAVISQWSAAQTFEQVLRMVLVGVWAAAVLVPVMASIVGGMATRITLSPLMPLACQVACFLSAVMLPWALVNWALRITVAMLGQQGAMSGGAGSALAWVMIMFNIALLATCLVMLWRAVMAGRFANW